MQNTNFIVKLQFRRRNGIGKLNNPAKRRAWYHAACFGVHTRDQNSYNNGFSISMPSIICISLVLHGPCKVIPNNFSRFSRFQGILDLARYGDIKLLKHLRTDNPRLCLPQAFNDGESSGMAISGAQIMRINEDISINKYILSFMKHISCRVPIHTGIKTRLHRGDCLLFRHIVLPHIPDNSFQFQAQHALQRCLLLCCNHLACTDHFLIKADGDILFQGKSSLITRDLRVTWPRGKIK